MLFLKNQPLINATQSQLDLFNQSENIILTTHRNSDGDGIGSLAALYGALKNLKKNVFFFPVDEIPKRYAYMLENIDTITSFNQTKSQFSTPDLLVILDTNQGLLCNPLFETCKSSNVKILFIDHHVEQSEPHPLIHHIVNLSAASTGEIVFDIIKSLNVPINDFIATALYSSLTFDTQAFKLVRNSARSHFIAGELAGYKINTEKIQRALFAHWTPAKMNFLAQMIGRSKYFENQTVVGLSVSLEQLQKFNLLGDDVNDLIDMFTLIPTIKLAFLIRQYSDHEFKISFRSSLSDYAYKAAVLLGGGGHYSSAGTWLDSSDIHLVEEKVIQQLITLKLINF